MNVLPRWPIFERMLVRRIMRKQCVFVKAAVPHPLAETPAASAILQRERHPSTGTRAAITRRPEGTGL
jgi:hypothetical protein